MTAPTTSVIVKATYIDEKARWSADERKVFETENITQKEVWQFEITIWSVICISVLITVAAMFISQ
jgi:hypothetical protein